MRKLNISLVVLNYNGKDFLFDYFTSVFSQSLLPDEVLLLDNASEDDSVNYVKKTFPQIKIVKSRNNLGTAGGSNFVFSRTFGKYVIFQSNDIVLDKNCVKELVKILDQNEDVGICTSVLINDKNGLIDNAGGECDLFGFPMQKYPSYQFKDIPELESVFFSYGGSFIIRREIFEKIGGFDDRYFTLNDDVDLSWRARMLGYNVVYTKKSFVYHKMSATLGKIFERPQKRYWSERNALRTFIKNETFLNFFVVFPLYLFLIFLEMIYFLFRLRPFLFLADIKAILWNLFYLPETLYLRFEIQKLRKCFPEKMFKKTSFKIKLFKDLSKSL